MPYFLTIKYIFPLILPANPDFLPFPHPILEEKKNEEFPNRLGSSFYYLCMNILKMII